MRVAAASLAVVLALAACSGTDAAPAHTTFPAPRYATPTPLAGTPVRVDDSTATVTVPGLLVSLFGDDQEPLNAYLRAVPGVAQALRPPRSGSAAPVVVAYGRAQGAAVMRVTGSTRLTRVSVLIACALPTEVTVSVYYAVDSITRGRATKTAGCRGGDTLSALDFRLDPKRRPAALLAESRTGGLYALAALSWR